MHPRVQRLNHGPVRPGHWTTDLGGIRHKEQTDYDEALRLMSPSRPGSSHAAGLARARDAMHSWRHGPAELADACAALFSSALGQVAVETVGSSLTASRLTADRLADTLEMPGSAEQATLALAGAGDDRSVPGLCSMLDRAMPTSRIGEVLADLARSGREHPALVEATRSLLSRAGATDLDLVRNLIFGLGRLGPTASAAVPELIRLLKADELAGPIVHALGRIGPAAADAVPLIERSAGGPAAHSLLLITGGRKKEIWETLSGAKKRKTAAEKALKEADDILKTKPKPKRPVVCTKKPSSFLPGTLVLLADGTHRPIEDIRIGDTVWATDPETGVSGPRQVTHLISSQGIKQLVDLTVGNPWLGQHTITATGPHPFWSLDKDAWVEADDLSAHEHLAQPDGQPISLSSTHHRTRPQRVHNLTVDGLHTYYVLAGDTPVLVHNSGCVTGYTDHSLQRMAQRGISEDMIEQAVKNGKRSRGNSPGTFKYKSGKIWVVLNEYGRVISVGRN